LQYLSRCCDPSRTSTPIPQHRIAMPVPAGTADETDRSKHLEMDLVFELPAKGLPWHRRGEAEQDAAVKLQRTRAKIVHRTEQLGPDAMILLADRREMAQRSRLTIGLETGSMIHLVAIRVSQA
jgi:hypothetical protein